MTASTFASLSGSMFATVVRSRQALVAARRAADEAESACTCERRCKCEARDAIKSAYAAEREVLAANIEREQAWRAYCAMRAGE